MAVMALQPRGMNLFGCQTCTFLSFPVHFSFLCRLPISQPQSPMFVQHGSGAVICTSFLEFTFLKLYFTKAGIHYTTSV